jgi:hypothetical protein
VRWTTKSLETILYVSEESYEVFEYRMMRSDTLRFISGKVEIISARSEYDQ